MKIDGKCLENIHHQLRLETHFPLLTRELNYFFNNQQNVIITNRVRKFSTNETFQQSANKIFLCEYSQTTWVKSFLWTLTVVFLQWDFLTVCWWPNYELQDSYFVKISWNRWSRNVWKISSYYSNQRSRGKCHTNGLPRVVHHRYLIFQPCHCSTPSGQKII